MIALALIIAVLIGIVLGAVAILVAIGFDFFLAFRDDDEPEDAFIGDPGPQPPSEVPDAYHAAQPDVTIFPDHRIARRYWAGGKVE